MIPIACLAILRALKRGPATTIHDFNDHEDAAYPIDHPTSPEDLAATIYHALGIDHHHQLPDLQGRPVPLVSGGQPVVELFG